MLRIHLFRMTLAVVACVGWSAALRADHAVLQAVFDAPQVQPVDSVARLPAPHDAEAVQFEQMEGVVPLERAELPSGVEFDHASQCEDCSYQWEAIGRSYYMNDQRIEFTGQESTFGVEGVVRGSYTRWTGDWESTVVGEFFLNQTYDRNILIDTVERLSYRGNFEFEPFEISQLFLSARRGDWLLACGKMPTAFGRTYYPIHRNDFSDGPFLRTESIQWRETGGLLQYDPGSWVFTVSIVNGGPERDSNSSKAVVARAGWEGEFLSVGVSVKEHDGIGSENQKIYKSHAGFDAMARLGCWTLSGEVVYDQYGLRRPTFDPNNITWGRSIYYRDVNFVNGEPLHGLGYYVNLGYEGEEWDWMFNYGEFYPQQIGIPQHDITTRRGLAKGVYHLYPQCDLFGMLIYENDVPNAQAGRHRGGSNMLFGVEFAL